MKTLKIYDKFTQSLDYDITSNDEKLTPDLLKRVANNVYPGQVSWRKHGNILHGYVNQCLVAIYTES